MASPRSNRASPRKVSSSRQTSSPSPVPAPSYPSRSPKLDSSILSSPRSPVQASSYGRNQSFSPMTSPPTFALHSKRHERSNSLRDCSNASGTFAPRFIKSIEMQPGREAVDHIEGENDFSGKRYVWLRDPEKAFVRGWVVEELEQDKLLVQCDDNSQRTVDSNSVDRVNPAKFEKANDMAELTYLNEASVVHNLHSRHEADLIYTYSGLFLVTVNPYCPLPIYSRDYINMYRGRSREEMKPHIFAVADGAFRNLVEAGENQSILVTGESGAGKTENTKKVIQYLAAVANSDSPSARSSAKPLSNLSQQLLRANPILESFGNAQTMRNNNSSRFGKFIRIEFTRSGQVAGAHIDWYLLEKSRVMKISRNERTYHIFYQLLRGADSSLKRQLMLDDMDVEDFEYTKHGNDLINGVSDQQEWNSLVEAFHIMEFSEKEQQSILRAMAAVLHLGNIVVSKESLRADQASFDQEALGHARKVCKLLCIPFDRFVEGLLHPQVKAGREFVKKVQTPEQVKLSIDALAKGIYERAFGDLVEMINQRLNRSSALTEDTNFIGVLDIAGFEIFEHNSFEQLCINYTNERLQQFFNHHMFVLEQEEYAREKIEWNFIDFGRDLQPTIDLIELSNPIGIFSCLDEDSVMPKATDKTFTEKLNSLWDRKTPKYRPSMLKQGFMLTHYAAEVEYSTEGWLEKNKDPLNDNVTKLLAASSDKHISRLFADCAESDDDALATKNRVKKGLFRTVAQRHKEQLSSLMSQLNSTHPHFVRCILPNHKKRPKLFDANLVLDQLRCNGVLEGIRIARTGFPNRIPFAEFRSRYEVLCDDMPRGYLEGQEASRIILQKLDLDAAWYRVGLTKVFFRAGVLAELEEQRDRLIEGIMARFQAAAKGFCVRRNVHKTLYKTEATRIIRHSFQAYLELQASPWWRLFARMRPLLGTAHQTGELKKRDDAIRQLQQKSHLEAGERQKVEEERRRAELETRRVQSVLESERALALDKEEIFRRLRDREVELNDKLTEQQAWAEGEVRRAHESMNAGATSLLTQERQIKALQEREEQLQRALESERARSDQEINDSRRALDEERAEFTTDRETIERLRDREAELSEKLSGALEDQDHLEDQMDQLVLAKKKAQDETTLVRKELEQAGRLLTGFGDEKAALTKRISGLERELSTLKESKSQTSQTELRLQQDIAQLNDRLNMKDHRVKELESKATQSDQERQEIRILNSQLSMKDRKIQDLEGSSSKLDQARQEIRTLGSQLTSRDRRIRDLENDNTETDKLRQELDILNEQINSKDHALEELQGNGVRLEHVQGELDYVTKHLESKDRELQQHEDRAMQAEQELAAHKSESARHSSSSQRREEESARQISEAQAKAQQAARDVADAQRHAQDLSRRLDEMRRQLTESEEEASDASRHVSQAAKEASDAQRHAQDVSRQLSEARRIAQHAERQITDAQRRAQQAEKEVSTSQRHVQDLSGQLTKAQKHAQDGEREVSDLSVQLSEARRQSERYVSEAARHSREMEEENDMLKDQLARVYGRDAKTMFNDLSQAKASLERMERELEGWKGLRMSRKGSISNRKTSSSVSSGSGSTSFV
ncbi:MAG: hypothetical protein M1828_000286 [Chrysothrix sp. TS-e1954]|nr:MAG: hypothetical protein M1828_000286 [Chrysothrix sp. TS-e1954]